MTYEIAIDGKNYRLELNQVDGAWKCRLDGREIEIPKGTAFVLLGRSGAGKSVALRHIIGLVKPDAGRVLVADRDIGALGSQELSDVRKHVSPKRPYFA